MEGVPERLGAIGAARLLIAGRGTGLCPLNPSAPIWGPPTGGGVPGQNEEALAVALAGA